jgi:hypothetical protein
MVKIAGGKTGSVKRLKKEMERSTGDRTWVRGIREGEDLTVRFLTEPDEWYAYREHYDPETRFFPCIGKGNDCPGCEHPSEKVQRTSRRFLVNALDTEAGTVVPLKLSLDLAQRLMARYERNNNTIIDRDYTLHRMGKGLDTTYDLTPESPEKVDVSSYSLHDLEQVLIHQFEDAFDLDTEEPSGNLDTDSDLDEDVPSEPSAPAAEDDEDGYLSREQALAMSKDELKGIAEQLNIELDGRWSIEKMVDKLFEEAGTD